MTVASSFTSATASASNTGRPKCVVPHLHTIHVTAPKKIGWSTKMIFKYGGRDERGNISSHFIPINHNNFRYCDRVSKAMVYTSTLPENWSISGTFADYHGPPRISATRLLQLAENHSHQSPHQAAALRSSSPDASNSPSILTGEV